MDTVLHIKIDVTLVTWSFTIITILPLPALLLYCCEFGGLYRSSNLFLERTDHIDKIKLDLPPNYGYSSSYKDIYLISYVGYTSSYVRDYPTGVQ